MLQRIVMASLVLGLFGQAQAWELVDENNLRYGATSVTRVLDVTYSKLQVHEPVELPAALRPPTDGYWVRFADPDVAATCRRLGPYVQDDPNPERRRGGTWRGEYVQLPSASDSVPSALSMLLFAQAHNMPVRVWITMDRRNVLCRLSLVQTCTDPGSCN